jgi:hypothetical protein
MVAHLSPLNPLYQQRLAAAQSLFEQRFNASDALERSRAFIYNNILIQQANYWSFMDVFYLMVWLCAACVIGVFLFKKPKIFHGAAAVD